jgi:hypothetical protein
VRMRRAHERTEQTIQPSEIINVSSAPGQKTKIFSARRRCPRTNSSGQDSVHSVSFPIAATLAGYALSLPV